jgi:hypothetical protein
VTGRLAVLYAPPSGAGLLPLGRRTLTGTVYRLDLVDDLAAWLDGDHQDGTGVLNWPATRLCRALAYDRLSLPWFASLVCGPVVVTGFDGTDPIGLTDPQRALITDAHAQTGAPARCDTARRLTGATGRSRCLT